jgi:hypothetical protein
VITLSFVPVGFPAGAYCLFGYCQLPPDGLPVFVHEGASWTEYHARLLSAASGRSARIRA